MADITGGCACGAIRFRVTQPFTGMAACFCTDCQKASGGAPTYAAIVPKAAFEVTRGEAKVYRMMADSGQMVGRAFCAECGTPVWSIPGEAATYVPLKVGALDDPSVFKPLVQIYAKSAQPWHAMHDGAVTFDTIPGQAPPAAEAGPTAKLDDEL